MRQFPDIEELRDFVSKYKVGLVINNDKNECSKLIPVIFKINNLEMTILIDDEFKDLELNYPLLNVVLALRELALIDDSEDFLQWVTWCFEDASNPFLLDYYKSRCADLHRIKVLFPDNEIDYFISDLDFELNAGSVQELRRGGFNN